MNLRTYPGYENIPWKQEGHAIQRLDIHIQLVQKWVGNWR